MLGNENKTPESSGNKIPEIILEILLKYCTCTITQQVMMDPVFASDGHTYEREAIQNWMKASNTSPNTREILDPKILISNWNKKAEISDFLNKYPELYEGDDVYLCESWIKQLVVEIKGNKIKEVKEWLAKDRRLSVLPLEGDYTAFHLACQFGSPELAEILLDNLNAKNKLDEVIAEPPMDFKQIHLNILLQKSLEKKDKLRFSLLLKMGVDIEQLESPSKNTLLHRLILQGNLEGVTWLVEQGASLESRNIEGNTPLLLAILKGHVELTKFLLEKKASLEVKNILQQSPISIALLNKQISILSLLVGPENAALPPLHLALKLSDIELIKNLLQQKEVGLYLEARDEQQRTPLMISVEKDNLESLDLLLDKGANPAVTCGVQKLTPLHVAVAQGNVAMVKRLLKTKVIIDASSANGDTPLHLAAKEGQDAIIPLLLEAGADYKAKNYQNQTPIEAAQETKKIKTAELIEQTVLTIEQAKKDQAMKIEQLEKDFRGKEKEREALQAKFEEGGKAEINQFNLKKMSESAIKKEVLLKILQGHKDQVTSLQLLPSGEMASASTDETLKIWDLKSGKCLKTLEGHGASVYCLELLPDGNLVSGSWDKTLKVWDLKSGKCLKTLEGHEGSVQCLKSLPNDMLVSGSSDKTIKVWDLKSGKCLKTLEGHMDIVCCLELLPNDMLVSGSSDKTIKVWDLKSGKCFKTLKGHTDAVRCLQLLPSGELVSGSIDKTIKMWDLTEFVNVNKLKNLSP